MRVAVALYLLFACCLRGEDEKRLSITIAGEVDKPCRVEVVAEVATLKTLIEAAGGLTAFANPKRITVVRLGWTFHPETPTKPRERVFLDFHFPDGADHKLSELKIQTGDIVVFGQTTPAGWSD